MQTFLHCVKMHYLVAAFPNVRAARSTFGTVSWSTTILQFFEIALLAGRKDLLQDMQCHHPWQALGSEARYAPLSTQLSHVGILQHLLQLYLRFAHFAHLCLSLLSGQTTHQG